MNCSTRNDNFFFFLSHFNKFETAASPFSCPKHLDNLIISVAEWSPLFGLALAVKHL